jgi:serine/threonine protein kinase
MLLSTGDRLGPYEIRGPLGAGGMGAVYRAHDPRLDRDVAIKVLPADKLSDPERRARFVQEAKVASALSHPNIMTVHDIGTEGDVIYLVMELVEGQPLDALIPVTGFPVSDVLRIGTQIADAFAKAHAAGIVHRDLKPANVMLQPDGRVKVLDFGLAKLLEPGAGDTLLTLTVAGLTAEGTVMGTPAYMSPEQAEAKPLDTRSDIFSFGALLYELCTGRRAFAGDSQASILAAVLQNEPQPLAETKPGLPPELSWSRGACARIRCGAPSRCSISRSRSRSSGRRSIPARSQPVIPPAWRSHRSVGERFH